MDAVVDEFELPPLDLRLLQPFGDSIPQSILKSFIRLLGGYRAFTPPLSKEERIYGLAELAVIRGDDWAALEAALYLKASDDAAAQPARVLNRLRIRGLRSEREARGAACYLSYLLAGSAPVRAATLAALKPWNQGLLRKAVERILPELDAMELKNL